jgi:hypothetical protein
MKKDEDDDVENFFKELKKETGVNKKRKIEENNEIDQVKKIKINEKEEIKIETKIVFENNENNKIENDCKENNEIENIFENLKNLENQKEPPVKIIKKKSGLDALLGQLKENKESTIKKSKKDWDLFKVKEGFKDEVEYLAKDGFIEKKSFLERTELRTYENKLFIKKREFDKKNKE